MLSWWWEIAHLSQDLKKEDPSSKGSHGCLGTRAPRATQFDRSSRGGPQPLNTQVNCEAKAREAIWGIRSEWIRILATQAGSFCPVSLGGVPQCLLTRAQWTWLYPFNWTCNQRYDDTPFKERFRWVPPPLVKEVCKHFVRNVGLRCYLPQSTWCNAVVLVRKKDGGLCFCTDFCHLNAHTKKDSYPLPRIQEALESLVGAGHFSCLDLKSSF